MTKEMKRLYDRIERSGDWQEIDELAKRIDELSRTWVVVRNGSIILEGTEEECGEIIAEDLTGELEMYPA